MNYNLKVEMERINGNIVTQVEVSGIGRATRRRLVNPTFKEALVALENTHDELLAGLEAYRNPQVAVTASPEASKNARLAVKTILSDKKGKRVKADA